MSKVLRRQGEDYGSTPDQQPASNQYRSCRRLSGASHAIASQKCDVQRRTTDGRSLPVSRSLQRYHDHCRSAQFYLNPFKAAAPSFEIEAISAPVHDTSSLESVIAAHAREPSGGLIVMPETFLNIHRAEVTSLAARYRLPTDYPWRFYTKIGGLLSYGIDLPDNYRRAAVSADQILKGAKPNELPVQAPVKLILVINLQTAKEPQLEVPLSLLYRADELVE